MNPRASQAMRVLRRLAEGHDEAMLPEEARALVDEITALHAVETAARGLPRTTPAAGGAGTEHPYEIVAGAVWANDLALRSLDRTRRGA